MALDASLGPFSAALDLDGVVTSDRSDCNDALEAGLGRIAALLDHSGMRLKQLDRIAVGVGPGSFTGIRIALSFAKALAYAARVPLVGISSYDILTPADLSGPCLTVVSGRPGIICARWRAGQTERVACGPIENVLGAVLAGWGPGEQFTFVTQTEDVIHTLAEGWPTARRSIPAACHPATVVAVLARTREATASPHGVAPNYGEMPAVTVPKARTEIAP